jgi:hypothetical protein
MRFAMMNRLKLAQQILLLCTKLFNSPLNLFGLQLYLGFSFPGIQGWVQQNFFNVTVGRPPRHVFELPPGAHSSLHHTVVAICA